nr:hypothetical protein [uncultured Flavobacterium sp.]
MKQLTVITLLFYYTLGTLCLPMGDFSILPSLPKIYQHCKATEDCDMTPIDFLTDHLINIDGIFDSHENGDDQKPHQPFQHHNIVVQLFTPVIQEFSIPNRILFTEKESVTAITNIHFISDYISKTFRPPIAQHF